MKLINPTKNKYFKWILLGFILLFIFISSYEKKEAPMTDEEAKDMFAKCDKYNVQTRDWWDFITWNPVGGFFTVPPGVGYVNDYEGCLNAGCILYFDKDPVSNEPKVDPITNFFNGIARWTKCQTQPPATCIMYPPSSSVGFVSKSVVQTCDRIPFTSTGIYEADVSDYNWCGYAMGYCNWIPEGSSRYDEVVASKCNSAESTIANIIPDTFIESCKTRYYLVLGGGFMMILLLFTAL
jgi:hypothetical protein